MKNTLSFVVLLFLATIPSYSQRKECGYDGQQNYLMQHDSSYAKKMEALDLSIAKIIANKKHNREINEVYTIPVVVHVIHAGEPIGTGSNINTWKIIGAIQRLNDLWRNSAGNPNAVDIEIQFCLATRDPNGNPTSGIVRVNGSVVPNYTTTGIVGGGGCGTGPSAHTIQDLSKWPTSDYLNIWVVRICGVGGFASSPATFNDYDGVVLAFGYIDPTNNTLTHEVGHYFDLRHTFNGDTVDGVNFLCPTNINCSSDGDKVCDTPPHARNNCVLPNACFTGDSSNSYNNNMSYCSSKTLFTAGQRDRIRAVAVLPPRLSLLSSLGCAVLGIAENSIKSFMMFPNPAHQSVSIQSNDKIVDSKISVFNMIGELILEDIVKNPSTELNISGLSKGIYLVVINNEGSYSSQKLIVE